MKGLCVHHMNSEYKLISPNFKNNSGIAIFVYIPERDLNAIF